MLIFFAVIRRELNYLPDLFVSSDFVLLNYPYDWWEDGILAMIYAMTVGLLTYARHYLWSILRQVPFSLYFTVSALILLEYMGENNIIIPEALGVIVEELSETVIYVIALSYLWRLSLNDHNRQAKKIQPVPLLNGSG
ncbi:MAG: hypothetical protein ACTHZO_05440 [Moraxellaceae bacterium]